MSMRCLAIDTETTGLPRYDRPADDPSQPRIYSLGYVLFDPEAPDGADIAVYDLVKPDGWTVPAEAAAIHGLTTELLLEKGIPIREALDRFLVAHVLADQLTGFNTNFDLKLLRGELRRCGLQDGYGALPVLDVLHQVRPYCKIAPTHAMHRAGRHYSKTPKLLEAYEICLGKAHQGAHNALGDATATVELYRWLRTRRPL